MKAGARAQRRGASLRRETAVPTPNRRSVMDEPEQPPMALDPIAQQAASWFALFAGQAGTADDRAARDAWLAADPRHRAAYARIEALWEGAARLPGLESIADGLATAPVARRRFVAGMAGFGGVALAAGGLWALAPGMPLSGILSDYRTGAGERRVVALPDGSTAELSAASALSVEFGGSARRIRLDAGEAYFRVAPDSARPFVVEAGTGTTTALGTAFAVAHEADGARVVVTEHAVRVAAGGESRDVAAGRRVRYRGGRLGPVEAAEEGVDLAWRQGRLVFVSAPLGDVVAALERWRRGRILVMDAALARRPVTVIVDVRRSDAMLDALVRALPVRLVDLGPLLTLIYPA